MKTDARFLPPPKDHSHLHALDSLRSERDHLRAENDRLRVTLARTDETLRIVRESFTVQCDAKGREIARLHAALEEIAAESRSDDASPQLDGIAAIARAALDGAR